MKRVQLLTSLTSMLVHGLGLNRLDFGGNLPGEYVKHEPMRKSMPRTQPKLTDEDKERLAAAEAKRQRRNRARDIKWSRV